MAFTCDVCGDTCISTQESKKYRGTCELCVQDQGWDKEDEEQENWGAFTGNPDDLKESLS